MIYSLELQLIEGSPRRQTVEITSDSDEYMIEQASWGSHFGFACHRVVRIRRYSDGQTIWMDGAPIAYTPSKPPEPPFRERIMKWKD